ncbi:MAG: DUF4173 domain-containing protein [Clostridiales bacterium]|nr:DUF4173 domain-containing protein [Clostridiales bacterium]
MSDEIHTGETKGPEPNLLIEPRRDENAARIVGLKWFRVYWILFLLLSILLVASFFKAGVGLGTVLWFALAEGIAIGFAKYTTGKLNKKALLLCVPIALINLGQLLFFSVSTQLITFPTALALFAIQLTYLSKPEKNSLFEVKNIPEVLITAFVGAFSYIAWPFRGLVKNTKDKGKSIAFRILIGVLIALPLVVLFTLLFSAADQTFNTFVNDFWKEHSANLGDYAGNVFWGAVLCIFVSAVFVGASARRHKPLTSPKPPKEANNVTLGTILVMVAAVVALFVGLQFQHWFGNVPANYIQMDEYANLARSGFFELVWASGFLLALIVTVTLISAKRDGKLIPLIKIPLLLLGLCNLVVLCSAVEKMALYIGRSGITSSRILALWLIAVIVACLLGVMLKILRFSFPAFRFSCIMTVGLVCALSFCNMDYYVAKNHIYLAENHYIQNLEHDMLSHLSYAAVKPMAEYKDRLESGTSAYPATKMQDQLNVLYILNRQLSRHKQEMDHLLKDRPTMSFTFSRLQAQRALENIKLD